jgi:hypothetical protein
VDIYGREAAAGVSKLIKAPGDAMAAALQAAATPQAITKEMAEELSSRQTKERLAAVTQMTQAGIYQAGGDAYFYKKQINQISEEALERLRVEHPYLQNLREVLNPAYAFGLIPGLITGKVLKSEQLKKDDAAFVQWYINLSDEEKQDILNNTIPPLGVNIPGVSKYFQLKGYYNELTPEQKYQGLTQQGDFHVHYHHDSNYFPVAGTAADRDEGPRVNRDFK